MDSFDDNPDEVTMPREAVKLYHGVATRQAAPPAPVRNMRDDWRALTTSTRRKVERYMAGALPLEKVTLRGRVFLRRHCKEL